MADGNGTEPFDGRSEPRGAAPPAAVDTEPGATDAVTADDGGAEPSAADAQPTDSRPIDAQPVTDARRVSHRWAVAVLGLVAVLAVVLDIVTKQLAVSNLREGDPVRILGGAVYLLLTRNSGAAWSMGTGVTWVFPLIAIVVVAWITWMALRLRSLAWAVSLGLVLGGALGNLVDRLFRAPGPFRGEVVDFISVFSDAGQRFPIFNAADSCLCIGVALAVILELTGRRRDGLRVRH
ncbi:MAG TPA: signal peptidase II [Micromonosporaceae bacterium]|nr:signal peptidase II [Micromonosporaceae bacterium]